MFGTNIVLSAFLCGPTISFKNIFLLANFLCPYILGISYEQHATGLFFKRVNFSFK